MNDIVEWFYCGNCEKDVKTRLTAYVASAVDYNATVEITAVCCECGVVLEETDFIAEF